jgi:hypothetical protein
MLYFFLRLDYFIGGRDGQYFIYLLSLKTFCHTPFAMSKQKLMPVIDKYKFSVFLIAAYFLITFKSDAQTLKDPLKKKFFIQLSSGYARASGEDIKLAFSGGTFIDGNIGINLLHRKVYVQPGLSFTFLRNSLSTSVTDQITFFGYGSSLTYFHPLDSLKKMKIYATAGFHYTTGIDKLFPSGKFIGDGLEIEKHNGITWSAGAGFMLGGFFIEICYDYFRPSCRFNDYLFIPYEEYNEGIYEIYKLVPPQKLNLDVMRIKIGYTFGSSL